jgi:hypothetical protein
MSSNEFRLRIQLVGGRSRISEESRPKEHGKYCEGQEVSELGAPGEGAAGAAGDREGWRAHRSPDRGVATAHDAKVDRVHGPSA